MALTPTRKTYAQLTAATDVQDADLLASYRSTGPLKKVTASILADYVGGELVDNGTIPTYALVADAEAATIKAAKKTIQTLGFDTEGVGGAKYIRASLADLISAGYPTSSYFRSTDRFMPDGSTDAINGGYWLNVSERLTVDMFGTVGSADDIDALIAAFKHAGIAKKPLHITRAHTIIPTAAKTVRYYSDTTVYFENGASLSWGVYGLPCLWGQDEADVDIYNPHFIWTGTTATGGNPALADTFNNALGRSVLGSAIGANNVTAGFLCAGGDRVRIYYSRFSSSVTTNADRLMPRAAYFTSKVDATRSTDCGVYGYTNLDSYRMGILYGGQDGFHIGDGHSRLYGYLNPATYTVEAPPHALYGTAQTAGCPANINTTWGNWTDEGLSTADTFFGQSACSYKAVGTGHSRFTAGKLESERNAGLLEIEGTDIFLSGRYAWTGTAVADMVNAPILFQGATTGGSVGGVINLPSDNTSIAAFNTGTSTVTGFDFGRVQINYSGTGIATGNASFVLGQFVDCRGDFAIVAPNINSTNRILAWLTSGERTEFDFKLNNPDVGATKAIDAWRCIAPAAGNCTFNLKNVRNGDSRELARGVSRGVYSLTSSLTCTAAASSLTGPTIPVGATVRDIVSIVTTAIGGTSGATGYKVGTAADDDRFGTRNALTVFGGTTSASWADMSVLRPLGNTDILVKPNAGTFDGTGVILVNLTYEFTTNNSNIY